MASKITEQEYDLIVFMVNEGARVPDLAREFGVSPCGLKAKLRKMGISSKDHRKGMPSGIKSVLDINLVVELYLSGKSAREVADEVGSSTSVILRSLNENGVKPRVNGWDKKGVPTGRKTIIDRNDFLARYYAPGESFEGMSKWFKVPVSTIYQNAKDYGVNAKDRSLVFVRKPEVPPKDEYISSESMRLRSSRKTSDWRASVFERDKYSCLRCGHIGKGLNAHHIEGWAANPDLRFCVSNGATLCVRCHRGFHSSYGVKNFDRKDFDEFMSERG